MSDAAILADGRHVLIRPTSREDRDGLVAFYSALSADDCRRRFFSPHPPPATWLERWLSLADRGGFGLVAVGGDGDGEPPAIVGDLGCFLLGNGNVELAVAVSTSWRGGLGSLLFDAALEVARDRGIANVEAEMLAENLPMFGLMRSRPYAVIGFAEGRIRVVVRAGDGAPTWAPVDDRPRLLVEVPTARWFALDAATERGWQVAACPGPGRHPCAARAERGCPLADGADVIVFSLPAGDPDVGDVLDAHLANERRPVVVAEKHSQWCRRPSVEPLHLGSPSAVVDAIGDLVKPSVCRSGRHEGASRRYDPAP